jgi:hypothetical protein
MAQNYGNGKEIDDCVNIDEKILFSRHGVGFCT